MCCFDGACIVAARGFKNTDVTVCMQNLCVFEYSMGDLRPLAAFL